MKTFLNWYFQNIITKYPGVLLSLAILLSALSVFVASGLTYNTRMDNLLPEKLGMIKEFNEVVDKIGGSGPLVVALEGLAPEQAPKVIDELSQRLEKLSGVRYVDSQIPKDYLNNRQLLLASRDDLLQLKSLMTDAIDYGREQLGGLGLGPEHFNPDKLQSLAEDFQIFKEIDPYYRGKSEKNYYIFVQPKGTITNTAFTKDFVNAIQREIQLSGLEAKTPDLRIKLTGSLIVRLEENQTVVSDLTKSALLAGVLTTSIILIYTRTFIAFPLIIVPLLLSLTYTFALTRLIIGHINIISGFLIAILMGLGVDYGIHLYIRFNQELCKGKSIPGALEVVMTQVGRSGLIAMLTTISVFSILIFSDFRGFSEFGTIAALGIICAFVTYFFLFPAQALYYDKHFWLREPKPRRFNLNISRLYSNTPYFPAAMFLLMMASGFFLLPKVEFEYDFQKLRGDSPAADYETVATRDFGFAFSPTLVLTPKKENLFYIHQALEKIRRQNDKDSTIGSHYSLNLFSAKEYESKKDILDQIRNIFDEDEDIIKLALGKSRFEKLRRQINGKPFDDSNVPPSLTQKYTAQGEYLLLIRSPADKNFFDVRNIYQLEKEIQSLKKAMAEKNIKTSILNENLLAAKVMEWVKEKGPWAMAAAAGIVFLILLFDMRSFGWAVKTFLPLFTGLVLTGAFMALFDVKLNFINFVMLPSIIGMMIDHCIYLAHHIQDYSRGETLKSLQETGSAIILSALTSFAGYASLNVASHKGIQSIATLVEMGIFTCTVCVLFMLPALFQLDTDKLISHHGQNKHP
ncbi:MAG: RND family transporter [Nitrospinales bacterium]